MKTSWSPALSPLGLLSSAATLQWGTESPTVRDGGRLEVQNDFKLIFWIKKIHVLRELLDRSCGNPFLIFLWGEYNYSLNVY